ncbi:MAG: peptidase M48 [Alphaproteobacteria bacterium]|nr:peptidase M48 [Alphaproteobacteria bacterium]
MAQVDERSDDPGDASGTDRGTWRMTRRLASLLALFAVLAVLALTGGCTTNPATGGQSFTLFMSPEDEVRMGAQEHPKVIAEFGGVYDEPKVAGYVAELGGRLVANSEMPRFPFTFTVLNSPIINAFALPGGYVYVTRGLVALANNEAELAGVIAHEIGHVVARHTAQRYSQSVATQLGLGVLGAVLNNSDLVQVAQMGGELYLLGYSREQEFEADTLGVRYMRQAGYDPQSMASFLRSLEADKNLMSRLYDRELPDGGLFATHPRTADRVDRAVQDAGGRGGVANRDRFLGEIAGMLYGDDPDQGFIRGTSFVHTKLRFSFQVPPGFRLVNSSKVVSARKRGAGVIRFDSAPRERSHPDPLIYLTQVWAPRFNLQRPERIEVNGMRGATAAARISGRLDDYSGPVDARLVVVQAPGNVLYRFLFLTTPAATNALRDDFQRTTYSFRLLSEAEAKNLQPLTVELVPVRPGDSQESLAARLPFDDLRVERFRVLNGLPPGVVPPPGERVKVIAD